MEETLLSIQDIHLRENAEKEIKKEIPRNMNRERYQKQKMSYAYAAGSGF